MANGRFTAVGTPTLLLFTDPRCGACEQALVALESVTRTYRPDRLRVLAVTDADLVILRASEVFSATTVTVAQVDPKTMIHGYRAYVTPLFYGVDGSGIVRSKGAGADERAIRRVVRQLLAEDHAHASEQPVAGVPGEDQAAKAAAREGEHGELL